MNGFMEYYDNYNEEIRTKRSRVHKIEFMTNVELLSRSLPSTGRILDVGAGTGIYSFYYANLGYEVDAIDIVPKHVKEMKDKLKLEEFSNLNITIGLGNALDLSEYQDESYDIVMCFGPIYHLREEEDRKKCISECKRVLKKDGQLAVAYLNKNFIIPKSFLSENNLLEKDHINQLISTGNIIGKEISDFLSISHFDKPEDIEKLMDECELNVICHGGSEGIATFMSETINTLSDEKYKLWLEYHYQTCTEKSILGISNHGLVIARK